MRADRWRSHGWLETRLIARTLTDARKCLLLDADEQIPAAPLQMENADWTHQSQASVPTRGSSPGHEREPNAALCGRLALSAEGDYQPESPGLGFHAWCGW